MDEQAYSSVWALPAMPARGEPLHDVRPASLGRRSRTAPHPSASAGYGTRHHSRAAGDDEMALTHIPRSSIAA